MLGKSIGDLGRLQRAVMEVLWEVGEGSVRQVRERLGGQSAYTTVLTVLQKLERSGWVGHRKEGKMHVYVPRFSREQAGAESVRSFMQRVFGGNAVAMFQHLVRDEGLSEGELAELKKIIETARKGTWGMAAVGR